MMQLRQVRLTGPKKPDAVMTFVAGANVISGLSDTGKSYILRCIDFVLGAEKMTKKITEDEGYDTVSVEFLNTNEQYLTLVRHLTGGDIKVHYTAIDTMAGDGETVVWKRQGKSTAKDVTEVFFGFAGMRDASLRKSKKGKLQRLSVRTLLPAFLVGETAIIAESSPMFGGVGYDETARKRMLSYLLTGLDDEGVVAAESAVSAQSAARAKLTLVNDLLLPIERRLSSSGSFADGEQELTIDRADETIGRLSSSLAESTQERSRLQTERAEATRKQQSANSQIIALDELIARYRLLDERYDSDLKRLDFVAEGSHFFGQLQESYCPLCDQPMNAEHRHHLDGQAEAKTVYESSKAEAAKILGLRRDLKEAIDSLNRRRDAREAEYAEATIALNSIEGRIDQNLTPALRITKERLDTIISRRVHLESLKSDMEQAEALRTVRAKLETELEKPAAAPKDWAKIDPIAVRKFCNEIEAVLKEWSWPDKGQVDFDEKNCDINVDGKPRISHGKGVRAVLHAAFTIALLRYCISAQRPHPGFVMLDSPLTSYKEGKDNASDAVGAAVDVSIQNGFWNSLKAIPSNIQVIVLDNKEPPASVAETIQYTFFAGKKAVAGQRPGFIP